MYDVLYIRKLARTTIAGMISGLFDALIDGGITFDASSLTTWNHSPS